MVNRDYGLSTTASLGEVLGYKTQKIDRIGEAEADNEANRPQTEE